MNNKTVEISVTVDMFVTSPTHGAYIDISSVTIVTTYGKLGLFSTVLFYDNMKLQDISCLRSDSGDYFSDILNI